MSVPKLDERPNQIWDSPIWNSVVSLPKPIWGSPNWFGVPELSAAPIWGLERVFPNWKDHQTNSG